MCQAQHSSSTKSWGKGHTMLRFRLLPAEDNHSVGEFLNIPRLLQEYFYIALGRAINRQDTHGSMYPRVLQAGKHGTCPPPLITLLWPLNFCSAISSKVSFFLPKRSILQPPSAVSIFGTMHRLVQLDS